MFREVREYRSLAYGVYAYMAMPQRSLILVIFTVL